MNEETPVKRMSLRKRPTPAKIEAEGCNKKITKSMNCERYIESFNCQIVQTDQQHGNINNSNKFVNESSRPISSAVSCLQIQDHCEIIWDCNSPGFSKDEIKRKYADEKTEVVVIPGLLTPPHRLLFKGKEMVGSSVHAPLTSHQIDSLVQHLHHKVKSSSVCKNNDGQEEDGFNVNTASVKSNGVEEIKELVKETCEDFFDDDLFDDSLIRCTQEIESSYCDSENVSNAVKKVVKEGQKAISKSKSQPRRSFRLLAMNKFDQSVNYEELEASVHQCRKKSDNEKTFLCAPLQIAGNSLITTPIVNEDFQSTKLCCDYNNEIDVAVAEPQNENLFLSQQLDEDDDIFESLNLDEIEVKSQLKTCHLHDVNNDDVQQPETALSQDKMPLQNSNKLYSDPKQMAATSALSCEYLKQEIADGDELFSDDFWIQENIPEVGPIKISSQLCSKDEIERKKEEAMRRRYSRATKH